jgi:hypothetical protein
VPGGSSIPYRPLTEALLQILRDRPVLSGGASRRGCPRSRAIVPGIGPSREAGGPEDAVVSPVARAEGVIRLIRWLGTGAGLLIALEDLHWADADTPAVLEYLADNVGGERILFVATSGDEPIGRGRAGTQAG